MSTRANSFELSPDASNLVSAEFLRGARAPNFDAFKTENATLRVDLEGLRRLEEEALARFGPNDSDCDAWLAPRLHCLVRLTRREARNQAFWRWMALEVMPRYIRYRWAQDGKTTADRFLGGTYFTRKNAASRLWWGAEAMRNGSDYREVEVIFQNSGVEQYVLDLRFGHLKPSALAFARVATGRGGVRQLKFDEIKELSKRVNLLLSATALESLAPPGCDDIADADPEWLATEPVADVLVSQSLESLQGPSDGHVSSQEIGDYQNWFAEVALHLVGSQKAA